MINGKILSNQLKSNKCTSFIYLSSICLHVSVLPDHHQGTANIPYIYNIYILCFVAFQFFVCYKC